MCFVNKGLNYLHQLWAKYGSTPDCCLLFTAPTLRVALPPLNESYSSNGYTYLSNNLSFACWPINVVLLIIQPRKKVCWPWPRLAPCNRALMMMEISRICAVQQDNHEALHPLNTRICPVWLRNWTFYCIAF